MNQGRFLAGAAALLVAFAPAMAFGADQVEPQAPAQVPSAPVAPPSRSLVGTTWQWQGTRSGDGTTVVVSDPSRYTIEFQPGGTLSIRADCNNVLGSYT